MGTAHQLDMTMPLAPHPDSIALHCIASRIRFYFVGLPIDVISRSLEFRPTYESKGTSIYALEDAEMQR